LGDLLPVSGRVIAVEADEDMIDDELLGDVDRFVDEDDEVEEDEASKEERDLCIQALPIPGILARPEVMPATETPPGDDERLMLLCC
jgi:hypothetical protein